MNGLALRISRGSHSKSRKAIGFPPVDIPITCFSNSDDHYELFDKFVEANTTDEQLPILKEIVESYRDGIDTDIIRFISAVFLHADVKHPVKCFVLRHVTKNSNLHEPFSKELASQISSIISTVPIHYKDYITVVAKIISCTENFNSGVAAIRLVENTLTEYLTTCLKFVVDILGKNNLSPTEKNEVFNLSHLALRLLLHIIQKANEDSLSKMVPMFKDIRFCIDKLIFDEDVPMDTKSVCGILYLCIHVIENGPDSWVQFLNVATCSESLLKLLKSEAPELCIYSAIVTVVTTEQCEAQNVEGIPAILCLLNKILEIGERSSLESTVILGVTRTVHQISKCVEKLTSKATGLRMVESLVNFAWSHLEHYMDSVRHLTAQMLAIVVQYCAKLDKQGDDTALNIILSSLKNVEKSSKSYYVSVTCLVNELGASRVVSTWPTIIQDVIVALSTQHIQASATTCLETLVTSHAKTCCTSELVSSWLTPVLKYVSKGSPDCAVINILENLLAMACKLDTEFIKYIIPHIKQSHRGTYRELKCVLMLLSVTRKCGVSAKSSDAEGWKGIIDYEVLKDAAIDAVDETRILSLSLIVESPKTTEAFTKKDLEFILWYLTYNINAQSPNFRQLTLSLMKKFVKRFEDSYKVVKRQRESELANRVIDDYLYFLHQVRHQCYDNLLCGTNYSRRHSSLQILVWIQHMTLDGYNPLWSKDYVGKLLLHLEDSYENNKALALQLLDGCPLILIQNHTYSISIELEDIFAQASSLKPTDCASAAYKLDFIRRRLPDRIVLSKTCYAADPVAYTLLKELLSRVRSQLATCRRSVVLAARDGPMYGLLHCITHTLEHVDPACISPDPAWCILVSDIISTCMEVSEVVSSVVNNSSPEGHLPMDMTHVLLTDAGNNGGVVLNDGRQVSAQMVLLCAWRSVKEVSLLLGSISSRLTIRGEESSVGTLKEEHLCAMGEHFTSLLAETKHRGAFEQAYVGFTKLLARLWRCRNPSLHSLPPQWLEEFTAAIVSQGRRQALCATRRSAGLPFMIQALVTTELQVQTNPKCFSKCISGLLEVAGRSTSEEARCHALNILRALFRHSALHERVAPYVGPGLLVAMRGFGGTSWAERNSSTLLLSALVVRVFGVSRGRGEGDGRVSHRNTMTGRIFFLRYPQLYDYMLTKLQEVNPSDKKQMLHPSLYPVLLLLGRLYPSTLEGTVSNLKLVSFIPLVVRCAGCGEAGARRLAARAMAPLVSHNMYFSHIQTMFSLLTHNIKRNYCHGILLQLVEMIDQSPEGLELPQFAEEDTLPHCVETTLWILEIAITSKPCYSIVDEYIKVINLLLLRFPSLIQDTTIKKIMLRLKTAIFVQHVAGAGRELFLSNATYLYLTLLHDNVQETCDVIVRTLQHSCYEVVLSVLNYLLILHKQFDEEKCKFQERLTTLADKTVLDTLKRDDRYVPVLCAVLKNNYPECQQKSLKVLSLMEGTQRCIVEARLGRELFPSESLVEHLLQCVGSEPETVTHVYLDSLLNLVTDELDRNCVSSVLLLDVMRVVYKHCSSDNSVPVRFAVLRFLETNLKFLFNLDKTELSEQQVFEFKATLWCTVILVLEDDENVIRQRITTCMTTSVLPSFCAEHIRANIDKESDRRALLTLISLLDFKTVVVTDEGNDECRVFDQNEKYNIFSEEAIWTDICTDRLLFHYNNDDPTILEFMVALAEHPVYKETFDKLCNDNIVYFKRIVGGEVIPRNDALNPKIQFIVDKLSRSYV